MQTFIGLKLQGTAENFNFNFELESLMIFSSRKIQKNLHNSTQHLTNWNNILRITADNN